MGLSPVAVPYASYLRVYEPLAAFPEPERTHWKRYAESGVERGAQDELRQALADLVPTPPMPVPAHESRDAFVTVVDDVVHVCPWRTRLRGWLALEELVEELPAPLLDSVLPPVVRRQATADHERWRERNPDARPWIRSATWHVPVRWFVLFDDTERVWEPGDGPAQSPDSSGETDKKQRAEPTLSYRTAMVQARRRVARGLRALRENKEDSPLIGGLVDVGRWLEEFHPRSLVELDYGGLVHAIPGSRLATDRSAADMAQGLTALREGDQEAADEAYRRLGERWSEVRDLRFAS